MCKVDSLVAAAGPRMPGRYPRIKRHQPRHGVISAFRSTCSLVRDGRGLPLAASADKVKSDRNDRALLPEGTAYLTAKGQSHLLAHGTSESRDGSVMLPRSNSGGVRGRARVVGMLWRITKAVVPTSDTSINPTAKASRAFLPWPGGSENAVYQRGSEGATLWQRWEARE